MSADNFMMLMAGLSCIVMGIALWGDARHHRALPKRHLAGYELVVVTWLMLGVFCLAKSADYKRSMETWWMNDQWLDFGLAVAIIAATLGIGLWGIRGNRVDRRRTA